jgi:multiple sugar transport system substrate-binding protein
VSDNSKHKAEAFKLVQFLMSEQPNAKLSSAANAFPGNTKAVPDFVEGDELLKTAFDIYKNGVPVNEFTGLPQAEQLMRTFDEQFQISLTGKQSVDEMLQTTQDAWSEEF